MNAKLMIKTGLGSTLIIIGLFFLWIYTHFAGAIPVFVGLNLLYLAFRPGRTATLLFGHVGVVLGCFLVTWGIYLLPYCEPKISHILGRPLFWGLFCIFGGICSIYHGFCRCVMHPCDNSRTLEKPGG